MNNGTPTRGSLHLVEEEEESLTPQDRITAIVRLLLARRGLRQMDLAEALTVNSSTMTRVMQGTRKWQVGDLEAMGRFFGVAPAVFFEHPDNLLLLPAAAGA